MPASSPDPLATTTSAVEQRLHSLSLSAHVPLTEPCAIEVVHDDYGQTAVNANEAQPPQASTHTKLPKNRWSLPPRLKVEPPGVSSIRGGSAPSRDISARRRPAANREHTVTKFAVRLSVLQKNNAIKQIICKDITSRARSSPGGHIYAFKGPHWAVPGLGNVRPVKIGHTSGTVEGRFREIARCCRFEPQLLFAYPVPDSARYEALVHATLQDRRWREASGCVGCGKKHQEWFVVGDEAARRVVRLWALFAAQEPYDEEGVLKDGWRTRLGPDGTDLEDPLCWDTFVCAGVVDGFINHKSRARMSRNALATPGILEAERAVTQIVGRRHDAGVGDDTGDDGSPSSDGSF